MSVEVMIGKAGAASVGARSDARAVTVWLIAVAGMVFAMAVIGAITRLTESGLSIVEWQLVTGVLPPLSEEAWLIEFEKYRQIPEYRQINAGMSLDDFKAIYFWEWIHRLWGRLIGVAFALPLLGFWVTGRIPAGYKGRLLLLFGLGGLQGAVGWFMVQSGLVDRVDVSPYRLAMHLGLALVIYAALVWTILDLHRAAPGRVGSGPIGRSVRRHGWVILGLLSCTIVWGAFVAGNDAGLAAADFPTVNGHWIPPEVLLGVQAWVSDPVAIQWTHRVLATLTVAAMIGFWIRTRRAETGAEVELAWIARALVFAALGQYALGIATVENQVPIWLGALHQAGAIIVLTLVVMLLHRLVQGDAQGRVFATA